MTTPDVPHRFEISVEVPGTPEQVWDAIATAKGISAWMLPTDLEEREGGAVAFHMGPEATSHGHVTAFEAPTRFAYEEDIATLLGREQGSITPLATEFVVEAKSGGTCVVRVVSSAFGTGADWEREFFDGMSEGWTPAFAVLRLYLERFPGQAGATLEAFHSAARPIDDVWVPILAALGVESVGQTVDLRGNKATVEAMEPHAAVLSLDGDVPALFTVGAFSDEPGTAHVSVQGHVFGTGAENWVAEHQPGWQAWLEEVVR